MIKDVIYYLFSYCRFPAHSLAPLQPRQTTRNSQIGYVHVISIFLLSGMEVSERVYIYVNA